MSKFKDTVVKMVKLDNDEWTFNTSDCFKHGQHGPKMYGSVGYVNWHLMDAAYVEIMRRWQNSKQKSTD